MFCFVMNCKMSCKWKRGQLVSDSNVSFHRFPSDEVLFIKWLEAIGVKNTSVIKWHYNMYLCSNHFKKEDFEENLPNSSPDPPNIRKLKSSAIPFVSKIAERNPKLLHTKIATNDETGRNFLENINYSSRHGYYFIKQRMNMNNFKREKGTESIQTFDDKELTNQVYSRGSVKPYRPRYMGDVSLSDLENPEKAKWCLMLAKEALSKQTKHIKELKKENRVLNKKMDRLQRLERIVKNAPENPSESKETITLLVNTE